MFFITITCMMLRPKFYLVESSMNIYLFWRKKPLTSVQLSFFFFCWENLLTPVVTLNIPSNLWWDSIVAIVFYRFPVRNFSYIDLICTRSVPFNWQIWKLLQIILFILHSNVCKDEKGNLLSQINFIQLG